MSVCLDQYLAAHGIDWGRLRTAVADTASIAPDWTGPPPVNGNTFAGIWGIRFKEVDYGTGIYQEFTDFPLAAVSDPAELRHYPWPNAETYDYSGLRGRAEDATRNGKTALQTLAGNPFEIYSWMTGIEEALINLAVNPELVRSALDFITRFMARRLERVLRECGDLVDIVFYADDLGSQTGLLMSPDTYRAVLKPFHERITGTVREHAPRAKCMMHSDGAVFDLLPDLIASGMDVLEAVQTDAVGMEPEHLKQTFGDRLSFHGAISVQQLLPRAAADTVEYECRQLVQVLGRDGGYIAAPSHAIQMGTPPENVLAMLRGVLGEQDYETALDTARCSVT